MSIRINESIEKIKSQPIETISGALNVLKIAKKHIEDNFKINKYCKENDIKGSEKKLIKKAFRYENIENKDDAKEFINGAQNIIKNSEEAIKYYNNGKSYDVQKNWNYLIFFKAAIGTLDPTPIMREENNKNIETISIGGMEPMSKEDYQIRKKTYTGAIEYLKSRYQINDL